MNIVASNHNRLLRGAPIYTAGGDMFTSGLEYEDGKITGYSGSAFGPDCPCDSAAIVDSAFDKSTAWVEEQNYLTAHQDVSNLPYVQNSALEFNGALISGISGSGFYAVSADNANYADQAGLANSASESEHAISATVSHEAVHALSADYANSAGFAETADSAHAADYAASAEKLINGYTGIAPIVVDNENMIISAQSAKLGVQEPIYLVEDTSASTVIGIRDSAFPTFEGTPDGKVSAINGSAINAASVTEYSAGNNIDITNHVISVTGIVDNAYHANSADYVQMAQSAHSAEIAITALNAASSNSATYDSLGRKIVDTYLTAHQDWTTTIQNASGNAYNSAVNWVVDQHYLTEHQDVSDLPYVQNTALESNGILISAISGSGFYATSADNAFEADHANEADYVLSGWEYDENNRISAYNGSAFAGQGSTGGIEYEGVLPIVVNNVEHKISAQSARLGVQDPLYFVEDSNTATVIGISGLPEVEGLMYESGLGLTGGQITSYNGSAFSAAGGGNPQVPVSGVGSVRISKPSDTVLISGKDFHNDITAASAYAYSQATAHAPEGEFIPYTSRSDIGGYVLYELNSGIQVNSRSGLVELVARNSTYQNEAHIHLMQNMSGNKSFWSEIDGTTGTFLMFWNSATINTANAASYTANTTAKFQIQNGQIYYSATGGDEWYLNTTKYNNWEATYNTVYNNSASWGGSQVVTATGGNTSAITSINNLPISARYARNANTADYANTAYTATYATTATYAVNTYNGVGLDSIYNSGRSGYAASAYINSWSVKTQVVGSTADATGSNILYIVTGS